MLLQVETDSAQAGRQPGRGGHAGRRPPDPAATGASAPSHQASLGTLSSRRRRVHPRGRWALGWRLQRQAPPPWSLTSPPRCSGPAETGSEGAREKPAGTVAWHPAPQAPSRPGCSCTKVLISSCPRLGAEHALGICHGVVGNFATVSRTEREEGLPCHSVPALLPGLSQRGRKTVKSQQLLGALASHGSRPHAWPGLLASPGASSSLPLLPVALTHRA